MQIEQIRTKFQSKSIIKQVTNDKYPLKNHFQSIQRKTTDECVIIWLKKSEDHNTDDTINVLQEITDRVEIFTDRNQCIDYITDFDEDEKVYVVISQAINREFIQLIETILQIQYIYVLKKEEKNEIFPIRAKGKVKGVFTSMEPILDRLRIDTLRLATDRISFNIISSTITSSNRDELDQSFMYSQLMKEIILETEFDDNSIKQFVDFCLDLYEGNDKKCESLRKFEIEYKTHSPLWWYSKETFIYSLLNEALRTQNTKVIIKMAFFLRDLLDEIHQKHAETKHLSKLIVYRGQGMLESEFEGIKKNKGSLVAFNNFLSTTTDRDVAQMYAESGQQDSDMIAVLFQMEIDSSISEVSYVHLKENGNFQDEDEVLFSMNTIFRINEINQMKDRLWQIDLIASDNNDFELQNLTERMRKEINLEPGWSPMGYLLAIMGRFDEALELISYINESKVNKHPERDEVSLNRMVDCCRATVLTTGNASALFLKSRGLLEEYEKMYRPGSSDLGLLYLCIACSYTGCGNWEDALHFGEKALAIYSCLQSEVNMDYYILTCYVFIGVSYCGMENFPAALEWLQKADVNGKKSLPSNHPKFVEIYFFMGELYRKMVDYSSALMYFEQALVIGRKCLPPDHVIIIRIFNGIGSSHSSLHNFPSALSNFEKALNICKRSSRPIELALGFCYENMGATYLKMNNYHLALLFLEKFLAFLQKYVPENVSRLGQCHWQIGICHTVIGSSSSAITHVEKAKYILEAILPSNDPTIGGCYIMIGEAYLSSRQYSEALSNFEKAFEIMQISLPVNHSILVTIKNKISMARFHNNEASLMLSNLEESLKNQQNHAAENVTPLGNLITPTETLNLCTGYLKSASSQIQTAKESITKLMTKQSINGTVASDMPEFEGALKTILNGASDLEQAVKTPLQLRNYVSKILNVPASSVVLPTQPIEQYFNMMSGFKKLISSIPNLLLGSQGMGTSENNQSYNSQIVVDNLLEALFQGEKMLEMIKIYGLADPSFLTKYYNIFGENLLPIGLHSRALYYFEKALAAVPITLPTNHPLYAKIYNNMAKALDGLERYQEALDYAQRAVDVAHSSFDCSSDETKTYEDQHRQIWRKARR